MSGFLYIVATPIGHLKDLTPRAEETLSSVDIIAAEDTRHTRRLLFSFGCKTPLLSLHEHNERDVIDGLILRLKSGESVALVSDAGTPLISDPGYRLVRAAHAASIAVSPIPGASALIAALSVAGIATDRFFFEGFLPAKSKARQTRLMSLATVSQTLVFYESVHRIEECLADLVDAMGSDRPAFIAREMTKMHEQCVQDSLGALLAQVRSGDIPKKGEFVVVIGGATDDAQLAERLDIDQLLLDLDQHLPSKEVARIAARASGDGKNALYDRLLQLKHKPA